MAPLFFYVNYKSIFSWCCHTRFSSLRRHCSGYEEVVSQVAARIPKSWAAVMIFVPHRLHPSRHQAGPLAVHLKVVAVSHLRCFISFWRTGCAPLELPTPRSNTKFINRGWGTMIGCGGIRLTQTFCISSSSQARMQSSRCRKHSGLSAISHI